MDVDPAVDEEMDMDVDHEVGEEMGVHAVDGETLVDYHLELDGQLPFSSHVRTSSIY